MKRIKFWFNIGAAWAVILIGVMDFGHAHNWLGLFRGLFWMGYWCFWNLARIR